MVADYYVPNIRFFSIFQVVRSVGYLTKFSSILSIDFVGPVRKCATPVDIKYHSLLVLTQRTYWMTFSLLVTPTLTQFNRFL